MSNDVAVVKMDNRDFYKAIKNYLHNDLDLSSRIDDDYINKIIEQIVTKRVERLFSNEEIIHQIIERKVADIISYGTKDWTFARKSLHDLVIDEISGAVQDKILNNLKVTVSMGGKNKC